MKTIKKILILFLSIALITGCSGGKEKDGDSTSGEFTELELWTFAGPHATFFEKAAERWNEENPDNKIKLKAETYPFDQMHNNLQLALQSGEGAPDLADIELAKFPNFLKGEPQLLPLNDLIQDELDKFVTERLDIYSKDGKYYGAPTHLGATVAYYNKDVLEEAGVSADDIETWEDFVEVGKVVVEKTGKPMTTIPSNWYGLWPYVTQRNSDFINESGELTINNETNVETLEFIEKMVHEDEIAIVSPGGEYHSEEFYGFMNDGGAASIIVPLFYMKDFLEYMPDLEQKMIIKPLPIWDENSKKTVGMGGTGTVVTNQTDHEELAKDFLYFSKLSVQGNIQLWKDLGFDPPRWDVWDMEELQEDNIYYQYFHEGIFELLLSIKDDIASVNISPMTPDILEELDTDVMHSVLRERNKTPQEALDDAYEVISKKEQ